jgi:hypothetical protein
MAMIRPRQLLRATVGFLGLAALEPHSPSFAEAADETPLPFESIGSTFSVEDIDRLSTLAVSYRDRGDHALALAAVDMALHSVRQHLGLYSLAQAPLLREAMLNEEARGNARGAWDREHELLMLVERHPDELRTVPILRDVADRRFDVLRRYVAGEFPPEIVLGCYYDRSRWGFMDLSGCRSGNRDDAVLAILTDARTYYARAIDVLVSHELYASDALRELEMGLLRSSYLYRNPRHNAAVHGAVVLDRLIDYEVASAAPPARLAEALVRRADWQLLFARGLAEQKLALETYADALRVIRQSEHSDASEEEFFAPSLPVVLPDFLPNPLAPQSSPAAAPHIDIAFDITASGRSQRVTILGTSGDVKRVDERRLMHLLRRVRFRPLMADGRLADSAPVELRYYVNR